MSMKSLKKSTASESFFRKVSDQRLVSVYPVNVEELSK